MARVLDLNAVQDSLMDLTLRDPDHTLVHLDIPTEELIDELQNMQDTLKKMENGTKSAVNAIYDLMARLINCNLDFFKVTAEELPTKYGMNLVVSVNFFRAYMECIEEVVSAKN